MKLSKAAEYKNQFLKTAPSNKNLQVAFKKVKMAAPPPKKKSKNKPNKTHIIPLWRN